MKDTSPAMEHRLRELWMSRPGSERLILGCAMFDDAKAIALAGLRARGLGKNAEETKRSLFERFYGNDFQPDKLQRILKAI